MSKAAPQTLIQMSFDAANGDRQKAAADIVSKSRSNTDLRDHLVRLGASAAVGNLVCSDRSKIFTGNAERDVTRPLRMRPPTVASLDAARARARGRAGLEVRMLLDATLYGGKVRMCDASKEALLESAASYNGIARDAMTKTAYYRIVAERLPAGRLVGQVFSNEALTAILLEAENQHAMAIAAE